MQIKIHPSDIVKRCLWDAYAYYVVGSEKVAEKLLEEDKEFELSERDAIVIGLLKVIETDNLIHRFNDHISHFLSIRSIRDKESFLIKKKSLETCIEKFLCKFPSYWEAPINYKNAMFDLISYVDQLRAKMDKIETTKVTVQNMTNDYYNTNSIKKILNFNNY